VGNRSTSLEKDIAQSLADQISKGIDKEILDSLMKDILVEEGWTGTGNLNPAFGDRTYKSEWYDETAEWVHLNAQGDYKLLRGQWLFKDPQDATMFILKWS
jgi:hypothetical protein